MRFKHLLPAFCAALALTACEVNVNEGGGENQSGQTAEANQTAGPSQPSLTPQQMQARAQARRGLENLRVLVDISDRKVRLFNGQQMIAEHDAAVGSKKWPTPTGDFAFHQVDLNPEWIPPKDEEWAKDEEKKAPGAQDNPLGTVRLVYRMPNTIHGTYDLNSLGKAESHGSIRVANQVAIQLAQMFLKAGNAYQGDPWFQQMVQNRTKEFQIPLEQKIPLKVQE